MVRRMNGRQLGLFALAALTVFALTLPVAAQDNTGTVKGVVKDVQGMPVDGAKITLENQDSGRKFETKTDKKGEFIQIGLSGGNYKVTVSKEKVGTATRQIRATARAPVTANFTLGVGEAGAASAEVTAKIAELQRTFTEGLDLEKAGSHDEAIAKFMHATELNPNCSDCFYNIGISQAAKKDYEKAEAAYKKAIEIKPDNADAYNGLANIYNAQRKFDEAGAASAKAAELASAAPGGPAGGNADALYNQGVIFWNSGKIPEAKKQFEAAIAANPNHAEAHYQLGMALINEGNLKGAGTEFDTYLKLAPNGPNAAQAKALAAQLPK